MSKNLGLPPIVLDTPPLAHTCISPEHNPPMYRILPPGPYTYRCPDCGYEMHFQVKEQPKIEVTW